MAGWLVVNADDLGVSRGATLGILRAHREGVVTSASLAVTTPDYEHALDACVRPCPDLGVGLHFTLTSGRPVSPAGRVPRLVRADGRFRWRFPSLLLAATGQGRSGLLDQVEVELEAQLERLFRDGVRPDHINGERHVHLIPGIFERVAAAARRHGIPFVRLGRELGPRFVRPADAAGLVIKGGLAKAMLLSGLSARNRRHLDGVRTADRLASYLYSGRCDLLLPRLLAFPTLPGVTEVMVHPGIPEAGRGVDLGNPNVEDYLLSADRRRELEACVAARAQAGEWMLTTFRRLARDTVEAA